MARPATELTRQISRRILTAIRGGNTRADSALAAGISERQFYRWLATGKRAKKGVFRQFWQQVRQAEAQCVLAKVRVVQKAEKKTWAASAWWLERRRYKDYGKLERREISGPGGKPIQHQEKRSKDDLTDEDLLRIAATGKRRAKRSGGGTAEAAPGAS